MTENSNGNAERLQALQHMTVEAVVDQPAAVQNSQNHDIIPVHSIMCNCTMVKVVHNSSCLYSSSNIGVFGTAG